MSSPSSRRLSAQLPAADKTVALNPAGESIDSPSRIDHPCQREVPAPGRLCRGELLLGESAMPNLPSWRANSLGHRSMFPARAVPDRVEDRLIVALDVPSIVEARALVAGLDGVVSFFKIGLWLQFASGFDRLIDELVGIGKNIFLDSKMFDIGESVKQGVARAAERGVSFVTVHGDADIIKAAADGKAGSRLRVLVVPVLTSLDANGLRELGYSDNLAELLARGARTAWACGCDGIIASPQDNPDAIRHAADAEGLLVVTPGVRTAGSALDDHKRSGTPAQAIAAGADYLVVGRPIVKSPDPAAAAARIIDEMRRAA
jgi:orotidine-5'-phosphate decarboxylase